MSIVKCPLKNQVGTIFLVLAETGEMGWRGAYPQAGHGLAANQGKAGRGRQRTHDEAGAIPGACCFYFQDPMAKYAAG